MLRVETVIRSVLIAALALGLTACTTVGNAMNPFYETPSDVALKGQPNDHALQEGRQKETVAREALQQMSSYERAHAPSPYKPVVRPAVVRLMWVPDHLNRNGDMVPAHYYYLRVLRDRWAVQDLFELEQQLGDGTSGSTVPFDVRR